MELQEIQEYEYEILKYIDNICTTNNITYYLAYGSLLGAVRHKGFIPWDDDIDIWLPRKDYNKLYNILSQNKESRYQLISNEINASFRAPLPKVIDTYTILRQNCGYIEGVDLGVYVDLFILDGCGDDYNEAIKYYKKANRIHKKWKYSNQATFVDYHSKLYCLLRAVKNIPFKVLGYQHYLNNITKYDSQLDFYSSDYIASLDFEAYPVKSSIFHRDLFGEGVKIKFMDGEFMAPKDSDAILKIIYGDYMKLPPIDKQVSHHVYDVTVLSH